ncbi:Inositol-1-monophosphatase SuhB [Pseudoclavibacter triregionum]|nr:Inositol-1-monophosphatase SuhB [Pseudoclavibacter triregionum]
MSDAVASVAPMMCPTSPHAELLDLARRVALEGAELALRRRREGVEVAATKSSITDVVTAADREVEEVVRARIAEARPEDGFYGEEGDPSESPSGLTWVVDPIDGTVNYLYGIPHYAVSVAVVEGDPAAQPSEMTALAGVVANPAAGETFEATLGGGARRNGAALEIAPPASLGEALVATGFSYDSTTREAQARAWAAMAAQVRDLRRMGAASLDLCGVACGRLDGYFEEGLQPWDMAAGTLIAREAGAEVRGLDGAREGRDLLIAAHPELIGRLERLVREGRIAAL